MSTESPTKSASVSGDLDSNCSTNADEDLDLFYFESDHLAVRGNDDYNAMVKALLVLEAQQKQAIEDYNKLLALKEECLQNPFEAVQKLQAGTLEIPPMQKVAVLPKINWSKYPVKVPHQYIVQACGEANTDISTSPIKKKPNTSSQPWTVEEQQKLEELLIKYPSEAVEANRYKKIANELGTRTALQVATRLQKYYLKLYKEGLPIPGRLPKSAALRRLFAKRNKFSKPSTFFPSLNIPVAMNEAEEAPGPSGNNRIAPDVGNEENYLLPGSSYDDTKSVEKSDIDLQIEILEYVKQEKCNTEPYKHIGYKCDYCDDDPIEYTRWHCSTCSSTDSVDFCTDCMLSQMTSDRPHPLTHKFVLIRNEKVSFELGESRSSQQSPETEMTNDDDFDDSDAQDDGWEKSENEDS